MPAWTVALVSRDWSGRRWHAETGQPIIPIRSAADYRLVATAAQAAGLRIVEENGVSVEPVACDKDGPVVVVADEALGEAAALYAHLTQRPLVRVASWAAPEVARAAMVVTRAAALDPMTLKALYRRRSGPALGLLAGVTPTDTYQQALVRAIAARSAAAARGATEIRPLAPMDEWETEGRLVLGGRARRDTVRRQLVRGVGLLSVTAHGAGIDAMLGGGLVLCGIHDAWSADMKRAPQCLLTAYCFRLQEPVRSTRASERLVRPGELRAHILVLDVCSGVLADSDDLDQRWAYIWRLLLNPAVGAVVTTWRIGLQTYPTTSLLSKLSAGRTLGAALNDIGADEEARLCLFGDPLIRLTPPEIDSAPAHPEGVPPRARVAHVRRKATTYALKPADVAQAAFLDNYLFAAGTRAVGAKLVDSAAKASELLRIRQHMLSTGRANTDPWSSVDDAMRQAVLEFLVERGSVVSHDWLSLTRRRTVIAEQACLTCGAPCDKYHFEFNIAYLPTRALTMCPRCGIVADQPASQDLRLRLRGQKLELVGDFPSNAPWRGMLHYGPQDDNNQSLPWPATVEGRPTRAMTVGGDSLLGPLRIAGVFLVGSSIVIASSRGRGGAVAERGAHP